MLWIAYGGQLGYDRTPSILLQLLSTRKRMSFRPCRRSGVRKGRPLCTGSSSVWNFQSAITWNDKVVIKRAAQTRMPSEWWIQLAVYRAQSQSSAWLTGPSVTCYEFPGCSARISLRSHRLSSSGSLSRLLYKILISSALAGHE